MNYHPRTKSSLINFTILTCLIFGLLLSACGTATPDKQDESSPTPFATIEKGPDPSPTTEVGENPAGDWLEFTHPAMDFRFQYPTAWFGPEVYETEGTLRIVVGSDQVYPYGTDRTEQITTVPDSYYITIQYFENIEGRTWDDFINSGWIDGYLGLQKGENGESITTPRSLVIRIREVTLGNFQGLEYITTLPDTAQTERVYIREIMAFDEDLNWLRVTGYPNLVEITDPENWKDDFSRVDKANLELFTTLAESIYIK